MKQRTRKSNRWLVEAMANKGSSQAHCRVDFLQKAVQINTLSHHSKKAESILKTKGSKGKEMVDPHSYIFTYFSSPPSPRRRQQTISYMLNIIAQICTNFLTPEDD
jgi:hypothetical protein